MNQMGFSELEFAAKKKRTRRERFLDQIEAATIWALLVGKIETFYQKGERGRPSIGIDLCREGAPDATALLHFRRLLEMQDLARAIIGAMKGHLAEQGLLLREGTMVDATIIAAPPSPRNRAKARGGIRFPLANLVLARRLLPPQGVSAP